jgi:gliding motility-associated lipoprotein GldD
MKATLYLNYNPIKKNLDSLLNDAYQLPYKHISKAESIPEKLFINAKNQVYGTLFSVVGNAASQYQFFLTDSLNHFVVGSLYFYARPNYDSIYPAASYLQKDIVHLMETLKWE